MDRILDTVADYQFAIYGVLGLILIFFLRRALLARREAARSIFKLEQETARGKYNRSVGISAFILLLVVATFALTNPLVSTPKETPQPTPTLTTGPLAVATLTPTMPPPTLTPTPRPSPVTATPRPRLTATPAVVATTVPVVVAPNCPNGNARITSPGVNQVLNGSFQVRGTANTGGFQYYKIEIAAGANPRDHDWGVVGDLHRTPVTGGVLATINSGAFAPGTYSLRLVVVDQTGNYPEPCRVTVVFQR